MLLFLPVNLWASPLRSAAYGLLIILQVADKQTAFLSLALIDFFFFVFAF